MKHFTKEMVDSYADKLLIGLTAEENKMVLDEFQEIDRNINIINEIPSLILGISLIILIFLSIS